MPRKHWFVVIAAVVLLGVPVASFAQVAGSGSVQIQAEIAALLTEVNSLQQQLASMGGGSASWCYSFNTNLSIGMSGAQVTALQTALQKDGESVTVSGTFDDQTAAAVTSFQEKYATAILAPYGLSNGTGYAGSATRAELNSLYGCSGSSAQPTLFTMSSLEATVGRSYAADFVVGDVVPGASYLTSEYGECAGYQLPGSAAHLTCWDPVTGSYTFTESGALPPGLALQNTQEPPPTVTATTGASLLPSGLPMPATVVPNEIALVGTPTQQGTYPFTLTATNASSGAVMSQNFTIIVTPVTSTLQPTIQSISPTSAAIGSQVTITGSNFGNTDTVLFNGYAAAPVSSNGSKITFTVPSSLTANCISSGNGYTACPMYAIAVQPGVYTVSVQTGSQKSNGVPFTVTSSVGTQQVPTFTASPSSISFVSSQGYSPLSQTLSISGVTGSPWGVSYSPSWLTVSPTGNGIQYSNGQYTGNAQFTIAVNSYGLVPGSYKGTIVLSGNGINNSPFTVPVELTVNAGGSPANFAASPVSGSSPLTVYFSAVVAYGQQGSYTINFGDGSSASGQWPSTCTAPTCLGAGSDFAWHTYAQVGTYIATLEDSSGNVLGTATVTVGSGNSASVTVQSPLAGQTFAMGSTMNIAWSPASVGVAEIQLVSTSGGESPIIYSRIVNSDPIDFNGFYNYQITGIPAGSYYVRLLNPENDQIMAPNPPGTVIGQSGTFTIAGASPVSSLTVSAPTSGQNFTQGGINTISWSGGQGYVELGLVSANSTLTLNGIDILGWITLHGANSGSMQWAATSLTDTSGNPWFTVQPGQYRIVAVTASSNGNYCLASSVPGSCNVVLSNVFSINAAGPVAGGGSMFTSVNTALAPGSITAGTQNVHIGSFTMSAPTGEGVRVNTISILAGQNAGSFQNLKLLVNGVQFGATQSTIANNGTYVFSGLPVTIPVGSQATADVYADVLSSAPMGASNATSFASCSGTGQASFDLYTCTPVTGQTMTIGN